MPAGSISAVVGIPVVVGTAHTAHTAHTLNPWEHSLSVQIREAGTNLCDLTCTTAVHLAWCRSWNGIILRITVVVLSLVVQSTA